MRYLRESSVRQTIAGGPGLRTCRQEAKQTILVSTYTEDGKNLFICKSLLESLFKISLSKRHEIRGLKNFLFLSNSGAFSLPANCQK